MAYAAAERVHASGVLAVVVVALYLGHRNWQVDFATRLQEEAVWKVVAFVLESVVFALIGLQLPVVLKGLVEYDGLHAAWYAFAVFLAVVVARFLWVFPATFVPRWMSPRIRDREPETDWKAPVIVGWAGMRGVVSLAIAFSVPMYVPHRNLILFLTFTTVIGTLVVQGLTLPPLIRALKLPPKDVQAETLAEAQAQSEASRAAEERLAELLEEPENSTLPPPLADRLRTVMERRPQRRVGAAGRGQPGDGGIGGRHLPAARAGDDRGRTGGLRDAAGPAPDRRRDAAGAPAQAGPGGGRGLPRGELSAAAAYGRPVTTAARTVPRGKAPAAVSSVRAQSSLAT